jgi:hypothetical protein
MFCGKKMENLSIPVEKIEGRFIYALKDFQLTECLPGI